MLSAFYGYGYYILSFYSLFLVIPIKIILGLMLVLPLIEPPVQPNGVFAC